MTALAVTLMASLRGARDLLLAARRRGGALTAAALLPFTLVPLGMARGLVADEYRSLTVRLTHARAADPPARSLQHRGTP